MEREIGILFRKEWRQLIANRTAALSSALLPLLFLGFIPGVLAAAARAPGEPEKPLPPGLQFGMLAEIGNDPQKIPGAMLPMMVAMVGLILPTMIASHLLISERERRTLELLVALPVRIEQVLLAKLLATLTAAGAITVPLLAIDIAVFIGYGLGDPLALLALPLLLVAALGLSTSAALLMSLLSPDFRTANNIAGALLVPIILVTVACSALLPGGVVRPLGIAGIYLVVGVGVFRYAMKVVTFERLLS